MLLSRATTAAVRAAAALPLLALLSGALGAQIARPQKAKLALRAETTRVTPGGEVRIEALATVDDGWHVQAHVPTFDYLIPTALTLELPAGFEAPSIDYPKPIRYKFAFAPDEIDVYEGTVRMPVTLRVPASAAEGKLPVSAKLRYQACDDKSCLPPTDATATLELTIVAREAETGSVSGEAKGQDDKLPLKRETEGKGEKLSSKEATVAQDEGARTKPTPAGGTATRVTEGAPSASPTASSTSASEAPTADSPRASALATDSPSASPVARESSSSSARGASRSLGTILLLALVGGLILNGMPCVLPILSLKVFGLVKAAGSSRTSVRAGALATSAGVLLSFWALAAVAIAARSAGAAIGWGVQFQQPGFVAFLAVVILLFSLNLWGLFEIPLPAGLAKLADSTGGEGLGGHFASGLFATLMATPCSAPFLGTALTFALGQSAGVIFATLTAVGVGLALPYLALALWPGFVRYLPKPGAWMDTLRGTMGFLLAGALVWLLYVLNAQVAAEFVAFFEIVLLALGLAVWLAGRAPLGSPRRRFGWAVALAAGVAAVALVADAPAAAAKSVTAGGDDAARSIAWVPYDRAEAERLARSGRLVFLDVTADWCVTCKVNERLILNTPEVIALFRRLDVVAMKADWTNRNDEIARFLAEHGRYGIPFYMLYRPGAAPHLFGELITRQEVIDVLEAAAP